jgi:hypothetical protein
MKNSRIRITPVSIILSVIAAVSLLVVGGAVGYYSSTPSMRVFDQRDTLAYRPAPEVVEEDIEADEPEEDIEEPKSVIPMPYIEGGVVSPVPMHPPYDDEMNEYEAAGARAGERIAREELARRPSRQMGVEPERRVRNTEENYYRVQPPSPPRKVEGLFNTPEPKVDATPAHEKPENLPLIY